MDSTPEGTQVGRPGGASGPSSQERTWAMLAHLLTLLAGFIPPLAIWLAQRETSPYAASQALESLNFQITVTLVVLVCSALMFCVVGVFLLPVVLLADVVLVVLASVRAQSGEAWRYPFTLRLVR